MKNLKQAFFKALPVIGPHNYIEAELLLAGIKPIGVFDVYSQQQRQTKPLFEKLALDQLKLDKAVKNGLLSSLAIEDEYGQRKYYCQKGLEPEMQELCDVVRQKQKPFLRIAELLGYRKRDAYLFNTTFKLSTKFLEVRNKLLEPAHQALQYNLLAQAGIRHPKTYLEQSFSEIEAYQQQRL